MQEIKNGIDRTHLKYFYEFANIDHSPVPLQVKHLPVDRRYEPNYQKSDKI